MTPYIPTEIVETIIDQLHDDKPTVATCALVSQRWLPRSRVRLFRSLTYHVTLDRSGFSFTPFLDFLKSSPQLSALIHELSLSGLIVAVDSSGKESRAHRALSYSILLDILDTLPNLSDLELRAVSFPHPLVWTEEEHRRFEMGAMRELVLRKLTLHSIGRSIMDRYPQTTVFELKSVLSIFSSVQELRVSHLSVGSFATNYPNRPRMPLYGQTQPFTFVAQDKSYTDGLWDIINQIPAPVRSLSLVGGEFQKHVPVLKLKNFGIELKHLKLNFVNKYSCSHPMYLRLPSCAALISLTLWVKAVGSTCWGHIVSLFRSRDRNIPPGIERLKIYLCCVDSCDPKFLPDQDSSQWDRLRRRLSRLRLPKLTDLTFVVQHGEQHISDPKRADHKVFDARLRKRLEQELSFLHEQGILSISSSIVVNFGPQDIVRSDGDYLLLE